MAKTSLSAIGFCGAMLFGFAVHAADTWFVKAANFGKEGLDGRTEETAWGTLQDAHDNAAAGDTVKVLEVFYMTKLVNLIVSDCLNCHCFLNICNIIC